MAKLALGRSSSPKAPYQGPGHYRLPKVVADNGREKDKAMMEKAKAFMISHFDVTLPQWKKDLLDNHASVMLYPYSGLQVSMGLASAYLVADSEEQIDEEAREQLVILCSSYGREHAEKVVPSVAKLRAGWLGDAKNRG